MAGQVWRFPFDDEIATLSKIEPEAAREFITNFPTADDIHPPFSYVFFYGLRQLGCSDAAMRLCSLRALPNPGFELALRSAVMMAESLHPPASLRFLHSV